jgi:hypothetical protein
MIADPEVRQETVAKSLKIAKKHLEWMWVRVLHSTYGVLDTPEYQQRLIAAFDELTHYIDSRLLLEETLPPLEDEPEPEQEYFVCEHGHRHRSERSLLWCNINTEFERNQRVWLETPPELAGTTGDVMDFGEFRDMFWSQIAMLIQLRDSFTCQFEGCEVTEMLEVHHIVPRRVGGSDHPKNLITLCHIHHVMQGTHGTGRVRGLANRQLSEFGGIDDQKNQTDPGSGV